MDVTVNHPVEAQSSWAEAHPDMVMRVVVVVDDAPSSLAVMCTLGEEDYDLHGTYLHVGCFEEHSFELYLAPILPGDEVPCGIDFQLGTGDRDLGGLAPDQALVTEITENGRCGDFAHRFTF